MLHIKRVFSLASKLLFLGVFSYDFNAYCGVLESDAWVSQRHTASSEYKLVLHFHVIFPHYFNGWLLDTLEDVSVMLKLVVHSFSDF
jgi:hypothetical protein